MTTAWNHLPNAAHIDRIIASAKAHPEVWQAAWVAAQDAAWDRVWVPAWDAVWDAARETARAAAWDAAWGVVGTAVGDAAWGAIAALIARDHSAKFLDMTSKELKMWRVLSEDPACILLLPAVMAFEQIKELELV